MTEYRLSFHEAAVEEAKAARQWYGGKSTDLANSFADELDSAIREVLEAPNTWPRYYHGTRRYRLRRFPFLIVYRVRKMEIELKSLLLRIAVNAQVIGEFGSCCV